MASKILHIQQSSSMLKSTKYRLFSSQTSRIENVLILGAGLMGSGIAQSCATTGRFKSITLQDVSQDQLSKAQKRITESLTKLKQKNRINIGDPKEVAASITVTTEIKPVSDQNLLIIEAVPEILDLKQKIFKNLSVQFKGNNSITFASNTSSLPCKLINKFLEQKEQFAGLHFFNPVPLMKLVEIAKTAESNLQTIDLLNQFVKDIDHVGVHCRDKQGFIVNRLLSPYFHDALRLLENGDASAEDIDIAMKLGAGYPMGPLELLDYVGLDTHSFVADSFEHYSGDEFKLYKSKRMEELIKKGDLGRKTGKGFYDYTKK